MEIPRFALLSYIHSCLELILRNVPAVDPIGDNEELIIIYQTREHGPESVGQHYTSIYLRHSFAHQYTHERIKVIIKATKIGTVEMNYTMSIACNEQNPQTVSD